MEKTIKKNNSHFFSISLYDVSHTSKKLNSWLNSQIDDKLVEPNSGLGQAISYMLNHWPELNRFLEIPGAPLDNNICLSSFLENPQDWLKVA